MLLAARAGEQRACATANPRLPLGTAESLAQGSRQLRRVVAARLGRGLAEEVLRDDGAGRFALASGGGKLRQAENQRRCYTPPGSRNTTRRSRRLETQTSRPLQRRLELMGVDFYI